MTTISKLRAITDRAAGSTSHQWHSATTLAELAELTAAWLTGQVESIPSHHGGPDDETLPIADALAAMNRAGYLTWNSQPGTPPRRGADGSTWRQRAFVIGFADQATAQRLVDAAHAHPRLICQAFAPGRPRWHTAAIPVTERSTAQEDQDCVTAVAGPLTRRQIRSLYGGVLSRTALNALAQSWQVHIVDLDWGRNDVLWTIGGTA